MAFYTGFSVSCIQEKRGHLYSNINNLKGLIVYFYITDLNLTLKAPITTAADDKFFDSLSLEKNKV